MGVTYDTGALVAADCGERRQWARHRALPHRREVPVVPAPVLAQAWRSGSRRTLLSRLLTGCDTEDLDDARTRATGALAGRSATTDIVNARVVEGALRRRDLIISSDRGDLQAIAAAISHRLEIGGLPAGADQAGVVMACWTWLMAERTWNASAISMTP